MDCVTVQAIRPLVINHYMLYPGERRDIARSQAEQLLAERPGFLRLVGEPEVAPAPEAAPEPAPQVTVVTEPGVAAEVIELPKRRGKRA